MTGYCNRVKPSVCNRMLVWHRHRFLCRCCHVRHSPSSEIQINVKGVLDSSYSQWKLTVHFCCSPRIWYSLGPNDLKLQITISTDKTVRDLKQAISEKSDVEADRQRLIYSGTSLAVGCSCYLLMPFVNVLLLVLPASRLVTKHLHSLLVHPCYLGTLRLHARSMDAHNMQVCPNESPNPSRAVQYPLSLRSGT